MNWETINNQLLQKSKIKLRVKEGTVTTIPYYNNMLIVSFDKYEVMTFNALNTVLDNTRELIAFSETDMEDIIWFSKMVNEVWYDNKGKVLYRKCKDVVFFLQIHKVPEVSVLVGLNLKTKKLEFYLHTTHYTLQRINLNQRGITLNSKGNKKMFHSSIKKYK